MKSSTSTKKSNVKNVIAANPVTEPKPLPEAVYTEPRVKVEVSELIRRRAYELFEERGRQSGHDGDDWLRAEQEARSNLGTSLAENP
jgi:hypothetical protein